MVLSEKLRGRAVRAAAAAMLMQAAGAGFPAHAASGINPNVPLAVQRAVEASMSGHFLHPDFNEWTFVSIEPYYGGDLVCGSVNYLNSMRKYSGSRHFFAVVDGTNVKNAELEQDTTQDVTGAAHFTMNTLCHLK